MTYPVKMSVSTQIREKLRMAVRNSMDGNGRTDQGWLYVNNFLVYGSEELLGVRFS